MSDSSNVLVQMSGINKDFPGVHALADAQLEVLKGEVHVLCGENGAGKSTLMKILSGAYVRDSGTIIFDGQTIDTLNPRIARKLGIGIVYQELALVNDLTVGENIFLGREEEMFAKVPGKIDWDKLHAAANELLQNLNLNVQSQSVVRSLGIGQQQMVEVAKAMSLDSKLIIMDEPTAALTERETTQLFSFINDLKSRGVSILYISHRLEEFEKIADRLTVMRDGRYIATKKVSEVTIPEIIKLMVGREVTNQFPRVEHKISEEVGLKVEGLTSRKFHDITFDVKKGEILGFSGLVGSGRTEVMRAIFGVDPKTAGTVSVEGKEITIKQPKDAIDAGIGFVTEDRKKEGLVLELSVGKNVSLPNLGLFTKKSKLDLGLEAKTAGEYIQKLNIRTPSAETIAGSLSGGNQQKVVLAKWLLSQAKVFIFDEPTRGIDVGAKIEVYNLIYELANQGAAIVMVSSDLPEVLGISDRVAVMCRGEILAFLDPLKTNQEEVLYYAAGGGKYID